MSLRELLSLFRESGSVDRIPQILVLLSRQLVRTVPKCMANPTGHIPCPMSDSTRTITKAMSNHFGRFLDPVANCLGSLLGFADRMHFARAFITTRFGCVCR